MLYPPRLRCNFANAGVPAPSTTTDATQLYPYYNALPGLPALHLPPLAVRIGAIYTLYCLYQTQNQRPRCRIYLPLLLLKLLTATIPEMLAEGAFDAVRALHVSLCDCP